MPLTLPVRGYRAMTDKRPRMSKDRPFPCGGTFFGVSNVAIQDVFHEELTPDDYAYLRVLQDQLANVRKELKRFHSHRKTAIAITKIEEAELWLHYLCREPVP